MVEMPAVMLRMKIAETYTLEQLVEMFNFVLEKLQNKQGPAQPAAAAMYYFPDVFNKPRDQYIAALLHEVCT